MKYRFLLVVFAVFLSCNAEVEKTKAAEKEQVNSETDIDTNYNPEAALSALGIVLKTPGTPVASYVHAVRSGNLLFLPNWVL